MVLRTFQDPTFVDDSNSNGTNGGFAFSKFSCRYDAMDAFKCSQKMLCLELIYLLRFLV